MSYTKLFYHIVFSTKQRTTTINTECERDLYAYIMGIINQLGGQLYRLGGMPDHIHILANIPANIAVADFVKTIKQSSSVWLRSNPNFPNWNGWEDGYAALSYSQQELPKIINYIKGQKEHHKNISFIDEYRTWLIEMGFSPNDPYFPKE